MKRELDLHRSEIERLEKELRTSLAHAVEYRDKYRAVLQSRSWRFTAPARFVKKVLTGSITVAEDTHEEPQSLQPATYRPDSAKRDIDALRKKMLARGFLEKARKELLEFANDKRQPGHRRLAALELAAWHLSKQTPEDARQALALIPIALFATTNNRVLRQGAILAAEAHAYLGDEAEARNVLAAEDDHRSHHDLYLSMANLEVGAEAKLVFINKAMELCGRHTLSLSEDESRPLYDRLTCKIPGGSEVGGEGQPLVSVIMPAHNSQDTISTAIEAVLGQSWRNLELFVVDDCSTDETAKVVERFTNRDERVKLIRAKTNAGPYVARNLALSRVSGDFVTCHDADDWSHPEKVALQASRLIEDGNCVGNFSMQARATNQLHFYRRGTLGDITLTNFSSFMFRRVPVLDKLGYWDSVRFAADSELVDRVRNVFGEASVTNAGTGPLAFQRQSETSLTGSSAFGVHGYYMGARLAYYEMLTRHHQRATSLKYAFPQTKRPFGVPEPFWPERERNLGSRRHYTVVIADDFRKDQLTLTSLVNDIREHLKAGRRVGLLQLSRYDLNPHHKIAPAIVDLLDDPNVDQIVYGEEVSCDVAIVQSVMSLLEHQRLLPDIQTGDLRVIIDRAPFDPPLDFERCNANLNEYFGRSGTWHPIDPTVRKMLLLSCDDMSAIQLSPKDWKQEIVENLLLQVSVSESA